MAGRNELMAAFNAFAADAERQYTNLKQSLSKVKEKAKQESAITISVATAFVGIPIGAFLSGRLLGPDRKTASLVLGIAVGVASATVTIMKPEWAPYFMGGVSLGGGFIAPLAYEQGTKLRDKAAQSKGQLPPGP